MSDSMRLERYLLGVEAWSELCVESFGNPDLNDLQTIAKKWCRVERDKFYQMVEFMTVTEDFNMNPDKAESYMYWGRFLQDCFYAQGNNQIAIPRCCDVVLCLYLHEGKTIRQFQALSYRHPVDASSSTLHKRLANQQTFLHLINLVSKIEATTENQKLLVRISKALKIRVARQPVDMAKLHYLAMEYGHQKCTSRKEFDPKKVFVFQDLAEFSEFPVMKFYENFSPDIRAFYLKVQQRPPQKMKTSRTLELFMNRVHKIGLNNTTGHFLLPYVKTEKNGWWDTFYEVLGVRCTAFQHHRRVHIDLSSMFRDRDDKDLNWLYTQVKHVFESFRQFRYAMLKSDEADSVATWNTTHLLYSNVSLYSELSDLKQTSITPDDIVQYLASVEAFCLYPQLLNLLEKITKSTDQIDIYNINPIMNGVPLDADTFGHLAYWLRDRSRFGTVKHETEGEFLILQRYWKSCKELRAHFRKTIQHSYASSVFKVLVENPEASVQEPMQFSDEGLAGTRMFTVPMERLKEYPELYNKVENLTAAEKVVMLLFVIPFYLLRLVIMSLEDVKVDSQHSATSSMVVKENFETVRQFAGELLHYDHLWAIGKHLTRQLTTWALHRNLVKRVIMVEEGVKTWHDLPCELSLVRYWERCRQPPEYVIRGGGVVRKSLPNNTHTLWEYLNSSFSFMPPRTDEPIMLKPYRLAFQTMYNYTIPQLRSHFKMLNKGEMGGKGASGLYLERKSAMRCCEEYLHALHVIEANECSVFYLQCCFLYCRMLLAEMVTVRVWNDGNKILQDAENSYLRNILWNRDKKTCLYSSAYR